MRLITLLACLLMAILSISVQAEEPRGYLRFNPTAFTLEDRSFGESTANLKLYFFARSNTGHETGHTIPREGTLSAMLGQPVPLNRYAGSSIPIFNQDRVTIYVMAVEENSNTLMTKAAVSFIGALAEKESVQFFRRYGKTNFLSWLGGKAIEEGVEAGVYTGLKCLKNNEIARFQIEIDGFETWNHNSANTSIVGKANLAYTTENVPTNAVTTGSATKRRAGKYTDNGDGTVTDSSTGLMWKQCSEGLSGSQCSQGGVKKYNWQQAMSLKGSRFAGYSDWRLPTIEELRSLVYCSNGIPASEAWNNSCGRKDGRGGEYVRPVIQGEFFPKTEDFSYWSSSPSARRSTSAWHVFFGNGYARTTNQSFPLHVRLVRVGQ